jgi:hypothetical protein
VGSATEKWDRRLNSGIKLPISGIVPSSLFLNFYVRFIMPTIADDHEIFINIIIITDSTVQ